MAEKLQIPYPVVCFRFPNVTLRTERGDKTYNMDMVRGAYKLPEPFPDRTSDNRFPTIVGPKPLRPGDLKPMTDATDDQTPDTVTQQNTPSEQIGNNTSNTKDPSKYSVEGKIAERGNTRTLAFPLDLGNASRTIADNNRSASSSTTRNAEAKQSGGKTAETVPVEPTVQGSSSSTPVLTRYGRRIRPPDRFAPWKTKSIALWSLIMIAWYFLL